MPSTELRDTILQRQREGATITQIAQELGVSRPTVYKQLTVVDDLESYLKDKSSNIRRLAYNAVERGLSKSGPNAARLGLEWLKLTDLSQDTGSIHVHGDAILGTVTQVMPSTTGSRGTTSTHSLPDSPGTPSTATEAAAKPPGADIELSIQAKISGILDKFVLHLCDANLSRVPAGTSGEPVLPRPELLQTLREEARRFLEQAEPGANQVIDAELAEESSHEVSRELPSAESTPIRANDRTVR